MAGSAEIDLQEIIDAYWKNKEGKPPTKGDLEMCAKIQDIVEKKIFTRKHLRRARKRLKKAPPDLEAAKKATAELNKAIDGMACLDRIRNAYGRCPVWNCEKHPAKDRLSKRNGHQ
ncbi:hypothetical protein AVEN_206284-1 [Araneus ventricosus]|uniref:Uncharacterized protein n=1 Tax=Araneus ventricosus TaxID=182803 RepID=A0A4Y2V029_ARAVE|nr:hypothetical protein AVEN_112797-1 [Araneus ventricosus]GBO18543.1 hypothetical protein AVEN_206284-1 [Araneus ventricosus]